MGALSDDGYLSITGRKKELIVTSGGKKIAPDGLEALIKVSSIFSQVVVVGEGKPYCCALVTLNGTALIEEAKQRNLELAEPYSGNQAALSIVSDAITKVNKGLASFETINKSLKRRLFCQYLKLIPTSLALLQN